MVEKAGEKIKTEPPLSYRPMLNIFIEAVRSPSD